MRKLKILSLQSNRIIKLEGLEELKELDQLYLSHNGIKRLEGLENNVNLKIFLSHYMSADVLSCTRSNLPH